MCNCFSHCIFIVLQITQTTKFEGYVILSRTINALRSIISRVQIFLFQWLYISCSRCKFPTVFFARFGSYITQVIQSRLRRSIQFILDHFGHWYVQCTLQRHLPCTNFRVGLLRSCVHRFESRLDHKISYKYKICVQTQIHKAGFGPDLAHTRAACNGPDWAWQRF